MLSNLDPSGQQFLNALTRLQNRLDQAGARIASGRKLNRPSDAPDQISPVLQLLADIRMNKAVSTNLSVVKTDVDTAEQTLSSSVDLLQQASVIASQATGPMQTAATRATLAGSVQALLEQMVANSNATVGGRYIFNGDADQTAAYQLDLTVAAGATSVITPPPVATRQVVGPGGSIFSVARSASEIFDQTNPDGTPATTNVFAALNGLRIALAANDDAALRVSIGNLSDASRHLNNQLAFYGQTQARLASSIDAAQSNDTRLRAELSGREDADLVQEITDLQQAQTQMQAALQTRAQMPRKSLFDLL